MKFTREQYFRIWLAGVEGIGARRFAALLEKYGSAEAVWEDFGESMKWIGESQWLALSAARNRDKAASMVESIAKANADVIFRDDPGYPKMLRDLDDSPPLLYVKGRADLSDEVCVSIVGTRLPSDYGVRITREIAGDLARSGAAIVSGFARGIDSAAHHAALDAGGRTIAVFACGVDVVYPPENGALFERLLTSGGSIVSEYPPGTSPMSGRFPARNRLISGISRGTLVVEGRWRSGAKITAGCAVDQGRDVFILPGAVDAPGSELPNRLAREGARVITCALDILDDLNLMVLNSNKRANKKKVESGANVKYALAGDKPVQSSADKKAEPEGNNPVNKTIKKKRSAPAAEEKTEEKAAQIQELPGLARQLDAEQALVYKAYMSGYTDVDDLVERTGMDAASVNTVLTMLNLEGIIQ